MFGIELITFIAMIAVFLAGCFVAKLPVSISMVLSAIAGALVGGLAFALSIALCVLYDRTIAKKRKPIYTITEFARKEQGGF